MVQDTGETPSIGGSYQPLNMPSVIDVTTRPDGWPASVRETRNGRVVSHRVDRVVDMWELEDEWWRAKPIQRRYFRLVMDSGRVLTVFKDLSTSEWFHQNY